MKKIIFSFLIFLIVFIIYYLNIDNKTYYLSMGDFLSYGINNFNTIENSYSENIKKHYKKTLKQYINYSKLEDYRVMDLTNDINNNVIVSYDNKNYKIQNLLIKANLITISIGMNDILYKQNLMNLEYNYLDELINDIDNLLILIRKYNKDRIYFLGFYNTIEDEEIIDYLNIKTEKICKKNKIKFVNINKLNNYIIKGIYPTISGHNYIFDKIISKRD